MRFQVEKMWFRNVSFVQKVIREVLLNRIHENRLDSWKYLEKRLEFFFLIFRLYLVPAVSFKVQKTRFELSKMS